MSSPPGNLLRLVLARETGQGCPRPRPVCVKQTKPEAHCYQNEARASPIAGLLHCTHSIGERQGPHEGSLDRLPCSCGCRRSTRLDVQMSDSTMCVSSADQPVAH